MIHLKVDPGWVEAIATAVAGGKGAAQPIRRLRGKEHLYGCRQDSAQCHPYNSDEVITDGRLEIAIANHCAKDRQSEIMRERNGSGHVEPAHSRSFDQRFRLRRAA